MRTKRNALFCHFSKLVQAEHLESAGVGQDGTRPRHEAVQPAHAADGFDSGAQVEMVGIAKNNGRAEFFEDVLGNRLDRRDGTDRHEDRGLNLAMGSDQAPQARFSGGLLYVEREGH